MTGHNTRPDAVISASIAAASEVLRYVLEERERKGLEEAVTLSANGVGRTIGTIAASILDVIYPDDDVVPQPDPASRPGE